MKTFLSLIVIVMIGISIVACANTKDGQLEETITSSKIETVKSEGATTVEETKTSQSDNATTAADDTYPKYSDMIPNPEEYFKNGEINIVDKDGGKAYIFQVTNFQDGEYEAYIAKCKDMGFTDVSYESENDGGKMFGAYTSDKKYWVEVLQGNDSGILSVTCKESTKYK